MSPATRKQSLNFILLVYVQNGTLGLKRKTMVRNIQRKHLELFVTHAFIMLWHIHQLSLSGAVSSTLHISHLKETFRVPRLKNKDNIKTDVKI